MRRKKASTRGRAVSILVAGGIGYLIGSWNATAVHGPDPSAAQTVALRFPQDWNDAPVVQAAADGGATRPTAMVMGDPQRALFDPEPMVPQSAVAQAAPSQAAVQLAAAEAAGPWPAPDAAATQPLTPPMPVAAPRLSEAEPAAASAAAAAASHRHADRPGFMFDEAQIASIKRRLHLTPDQERMWPAVEAALRNIAFAKAREAHRRGAAAAKVQAGTLDPDSAEVQDLKSAAIPLIMSFSDEQKDEVRSLAHVMGLDQLASQF